MEAVTGLKYTPERDWEGGRADEQSGPGVQRAGRDLPVRDHTLPERLMTEPLKAGASKGQMISKDDLNQMLDEYYTERGWDLRTGAPTRQKLTELGLGDALSNWVLGDCLISAVPCPCEARMSMVKEAIHLAS